VITHLVDSDWVIDYLGNISGARQVLGSLIEQGSLATSIIVYAEVYEGILDDANFEGRLKSLFDLWAGVPVLGLDEETAQRFARLRSDFRLRGQLIPDHDMWIAATALRHDLALLSRDQHFDRVADLRRS
jgi:tRNA(fMet)-specific endonuclease VapC